MKSCQFEKHARRLVPHRVVRRRGGRRRASPHGEQGWTAVCATCTAMRSTASSRGSASSTSPAGRSRATPTLVRARPRRSRAQTPSCRASAGSRATRRHRRVSRRRAGRASVPRASRPAGTGDIPVLFASYSPEDQAAYRAANGPPNERVAAAASAAGCARFVLVGVAADAENGLAGGIPGYFEGKADALSAAQADASVALARPPLGPRPQPPVALSARVLF